MNKTIYDVTAKCPPGYKRGRQERQYHASTQTEGNYIIFDFDETCRDMIRKGFLIQEGFTLETTEGTYLVLEEWHETGKEVHPNRVHCRAVQTSAAAA